MYRNSVYAPRRPATRTKAARAARLALLLLCLAAPAAARAQSNAFNSGSTGADGAFAPTASQTITVPESGVFNFTTVNIPGGVHITFARNSKNTPVTILASGNVTIIGSIDVSGKSNNAIYNGGGADGGPGGFNGGGGGCPGDPANFAGTTGDGPGGGTGGASNGTSAGGGGGGGYSSAGGNGVGPAQFGGQGGPRYGASNVMPLVGGSGGGGGGNLSSQNHCGSGGGGGGGAILIASSGSITLPATGSRAIHAGGGNSLSGPTGGGGGAGGAIRLIANTISGFTSLNVEGGYSYTANGDTPALGGGRGAQGYVRIEAYEYRNFGNTGGGPIYFALPNPVTPPNAPRMRIASVAGVAAPASPIGAMHSPPDIVLPTTRTGPVEVVIEANNIAVGTVLSVTVTPERGARTTVQSGGLTGTEAASTARASVSLPAGVSVVSATAVVDLTTAKAEPLFIDGERVARVEIAATFGGASEVTYVTSTGRRLKKRGE